jgi:phage repressor protein C with HTH and peptisase S24 domain
MRTDSATREEQAARLRRAREAAGYKQPIDAVRKFNWKPSTYLAHENTQNGISAQTALVYGKAFKVDPGWLLTGVGAGPSGKHSKTVEQSAEDFIPIGRFDASFSMGPGSLIAERPEPLGHWMVESQWLRGVTAAPPDSLDIVRVSGDSMHPTLLDGDRV